MSRHDRGPVRHARERLLQAFFCKRRGHYSHYASTKTECQDSVRRGEVPFWSYAEPSFATQNYAAKSRANIYSVVETILTAPSDLTFA